MYFTTNLKRRASRSKIRIFKCVSRLYKKRMHRVLSESFLQKYCVDKLLWHCVHQDQENFWVVAKSAGIEPVLSPESNKPFVFRWDIPLHGMIAKRVYCSLSKNGTLTIKDSITSSISARSCYRNGDLYGRLYSEMNRSEDIVLRLQTMILDTLQRVHALDYYEVDYNVCFCSHLYWEPDNSFIELGYYPDYSTIIAYLNS